MLTLWDGSLLRGSRVPCDPAPEHVWELRGVCMLVRSSNENEMNWCAAESLVHVDTKAALTGVFKEKSSFKMHVVSGET